MNRQALNLGASALASAALLAGGADAATLTGNLTGDNDFVAYLSTSASSLGTPIASGTTWENVQTISSSLTSGTNYYLQVVVLNYAPGQKSYSGTIDPSSANNPDMFIGSFSISGLGFHFENGTTTLDTDTTDWTAYLDATPADFGSSFSSAWTRPTDAPTSYGTNGTGIWETVNGGPLTGIDSSAQYLWASGNDTGEAFFETEIIDPPLPAPEPASWALMLVGIGGVGGAYRFGRRGRESRAVA